VVADCCGTPTFREIQVFAVPEPSTLSVLVAGLPGLATRPRHPAPPARRQLAAPAAALSARPSGHFPYLRRYSPGVMPVCFLKNRDMYSW